MPILDELIKLILARGGSAENVYNIADACAELVRIENENAAEEETEEEDDGETGGDGQT